MRCAPDKLPLPRTFVAVKSVNLSALQLSPEQQNLSLRSVVWLHVLGGRWEGYLFSHLFLYIEVRACIIDMKKSCITE